MNNPPETSAPRTDDAQFGTGRVSVSFARALETELAAANAKLAEWRDVAKHLVLVVENANCSCSLLRGDCSRCAALTRFNNLNTTEK